MKEEAEDWIGGILSVFLQWLWMLLLLGSIFWLISSTWNTDAAISGRRMVMYVVERDILLRKMVWMGRGIWIRLPNITSWQTTGVLGEVGSTLLIMMDGR